jgi:hypothetical protein
VAIALSRLLLAFASEYSVAECVLAPLANQGIKGRRLQEPAGAL